VYGFKKKTRQNPYKENQKSQRKKNYEFFNSKIARIKQKRRFNVAVGQSIKKPECIASTQNHTTSREERAYRIYRKNTNQNHEFSNKTRSTWQTNVC
jgi:hypothetical protein